MRRSRRRSLTLSVLGSLGTIALVLVCCLPASAATLPGQFWVSKLKLSKVWKITRGAGVTVAVVDSGVPATQDLGSRLLPGTSFVGGSARSDPGQAAGGGGQLYSHGQQMASLIAGDGSRGTTGVAPQAKILPVKVQDRTGGALSPTVAAQGIRYAVTHGAKVINLSINGPGSCDSGSAAAVKYAYQHDVIVVASTGNEGKADVEDPADCAGVLAVSAVSSTGAPWSGSDYGTQVDLTNYGVAVPTLTLNGSAASSNGTSQSAAFTSGEIALLRAKFPKDSARAVVTRLLYGSDTLSKVPTGTHVNDHVGYGLPVPLYALTAKIPSGYDVNPIYDEFAKELGSGSGNASSNSSGGPSGAPSSTTGGASEPSLDPGPTPSTAASGGDSGGVNTVVIVVIVVVVIAAIVIAVVVGRSRRRRSPPGYGPPTGGYGPPGR